MRSYDHWLITGCQNKTRINTESDSRRYFVDNKITILWLHSRDKVDMLVSKQAQNVAQVVHNNILKFRKEFLCYCYVHQHGRRDVRCKPRIWIDKMHLRS